jgi:hypothetical protein
MTLNPSEWQARLETISIKQLLHLYEMSMFPKSIGEEETLTPSRSYFPEEPDSWINVPSGTSPKRSRLETEIDNRITKVYWDVHAKSNPTVSWSDFSGFRWWISIWDHFQENLRVIVCGVRIGYPSFSPGRLAKPELWDESSDEEGS